MPTGSSFVCPHCGEELPAKAKACPSCGSDENTGWSVDTYLDGLDIPALDDDEYEEIRAREFGGSSFTNKRGAVSGIRIDGKMIVGMTVLAAMLFAFVFRGC